MGTKTQERSTTPRKKDGVTSLVDATGYPLEYSFFGNRKIRIPLGNPNYNDQGTLIKDFTETRLYFTIREISDKAGDYLRRALNYLVSFSKYLPQ